MNPAEGGAVPLRVFVGHAFGFMADEDPERDCADRLAGTGEQSLVGCIADEDHERSCTLEVKR